jgi:hypothetical protein
MGLLECPRRMLGIGRGRRAAPGEATPHEVPNNPELSEHLANLREKGSASDQEIAKIRELAGNLSFTEAKAIRETLKELVGVSEPARASLDQYMWDEVEKRAEHVEQSKKRSDIIGVTTLASTVVGVPVLNFMLATTGVDVSSGINAAANGVQIALLAGEYLGGFALARFVASRLQRREEEYGESD